MGPTPFGLYVFAVMPAPAGVSPLVSPGPFRDEDAYLNLAPSIVGLLEDTGAFDEVFHFRNPERDRATSQMNNLVTLTHLGGRNKPQQSPFRYARVVSYGLTLKVRAQEQEDGATAAGRFYAICFNALSAKSYGGFTLFEDSILTDDSYDDSRHPEVRVKIRGQFCYVVEAAEAGVQGSGLRETA